jgi:hypothetical protein
MFLFLPALPLIHIAAPKTKKSTERREWKERERDKGELCCERGAELKGDLGRDCLGRIGEVE